MTDLDRESLDRILPDTTGSPDWGDVMSRAGVVQSRQRRRFVAFVAATSVLVLTVTSALAVRAVVLDRGFIGLPPEGAQPSLPNSGELVLRAYGLGHGARTRLWVYADGRVVAQQELHDRPTRPSDANESSSGFFERRLNPEGVERIRSEALASGLFDRDRELLARDGGPCLSFIHVRRDDRLVRVEWHGEQCPSDGSIPTATQEETSVLRTLVSRLTNPNEWLPASAWQDPTSRAYVPSALAISIISPRRLDPSRVLSVLPQAAADLLRSNAISSLQGDPYASYDFVAKLTADEARALSKSLDAAGLKKGPHQSQAYALSYSGKVPEYGGPRVFIISFEPILPHGEFTCSACG
jgi:hypothetical protein